MPKKKKIINDFERSSQTYFKEISKYKTLSKDEEFSLWEKYKKNHDLKARDKIIESNLKFVANVAKSYIGMGLSYSDLIAEGNLGLLRAIEKFDYKKDVKTISYSVWWIKQSILDALNNRNEIKSDELPKDYEKSLDFDAEDSYNVNESNRSAMSVFVENENNDISKKEMVKVVSSLLECLTPRERKVISYYFGIGEKDELTLEDIGKLMGLTKERVRQIKERGFKKMRSEALSRQIKAEW